MKIDSIQNPNRTNISIADSTKRGLSSHRQAIQIQNDVSPFLTITAPPPPLAPISPQYKCKRMFFQLKVAKYRRSLPQISVLNTKIYVLLAPHTRQKSPVSSRGRFFLPRHCIIETDVADTRKNTLLLYINFILLLLLRSSSMFMLQNSFDWNIERERKMGGGNSITIFSLKAIKNIFVSMVKYFLCL